MKLSNSNIKKFLTFQETETPKIFFYLLKRKLFLYFGKWKSPPQKKFLMFQEAKAQKKFLVFQEVTFQA